MSSLNIDEAKLKTAVSKSFRNWHKEDWNDPLLLSLRTVQDELTSQPSQQSDDSNQVGKKLAVKTVLQRALDVLDIQNKDLYNILKNRFIQDRTLEQTREILHKSIPTIARNQNVAYDLIVKILIRFESEAADKIIQKQELLLPKPSYTHLFGIESTRKTLSQLILDDENYHLVALNGIGGIGKTSLARAIASDIVATLHFERVLWITISQDAHSMSRSTSALYSNFISQLAPELLPKIQAMPTEQLEKLIWPILKATPYLIVIDNLEIEGEITELVEQLKGLVQPTKILFGSRARPSQPMVYCHDVTDISYEDAYEFVRYLIRNGNFEPLAK